MVGYMIYQKKQKKDIDEYLKLPIDGYVYLDLDFKLD